MKQTFHEFLELVRKSAYAHLSNVFFRAITYFIFSNLPRFELYITKNARRFTYSNDSLCDNDNPVRNKTVSAAVA